MSLTMVPIIYMFYDEVKEMTTTIPEVTYKFGFVDEKGRLLRQRM